MSKWDRPHGSQPAGGKIGDHELFSVGLTVTPCSGEAVESKITRSANDVRRRVFPLLRFRRRLHIQHRSEDYSRGTGKCWCAHCCRAITAQEVSL